GDPAARGGAAGAGTAAPRGARPADGPAAAGGRTGRALGGPAGGGTGTHPAGGAGPAGRRRARGVRAAALSGGTAATRLATLLRGVAVSSTPPVPGPSR